MSKYSFIFFFILFYWQFEQFFIHEKKSFLNDWFISIYIYIYIYIHIYIYIYIYFSLAARFLTWTGANLFPLSIVKNGFLACSTLLRWLKETNLHLSTSRSVYHFSFCVVLEVCENYGAVYCNSFYDVFVKPDSLSQPTKSVGNIWHSCV